MAPRLYLRFEIELKDRGGRVDNADEGGSARDHSESFGSFITCPEPKLKVSNTELVGSFFFNAFTIGPYRFTI